MRAFIYILLLSLGMISCQSSTPSNNEILFVDVIGNYQGECADFTSSTMELENREDATLSVIAASINAAGIRTSCTRMEDQDLPLKSATAARIEFEKIVNGSVISMTYIAQTDSIVIVQTSAGQVENLIFTGRRG